jgi:quercetin dioxygenase-like cupin family protein
MTTGSQPAGFARGPNDSEALIWMGELTLLKVTGEQSGGNYSLAEVHATPEGLVPLHVHHREDEAFYVLDGDVTFYVGDETFEGHAGSFVFGPKDVPHRYVVNSPTARMLMVFSPAGFEGFIRATSEPATTLVPPVAGSVEVDFDKVIEAAGMYGAEVLD